MLTCEQKQSVYSSRFMIYTVARIQYSLQSKSGMLCEHVLTSIADLFGRIDTRWAEFSREFDGNVTMIIL